jgi:hypothetical protein
MMMKKLILLAIILFSIQYLTVANPNEGFNFGFEKNTSNTSFSDGWQVSGLGNFRVKKDSMSVYSGKYAACITADGDSKSFGKIVFKIPNNYRAKWVNLEGYMKTQDVKGYAGLAIHFEEEGNVISSVNMRNQAIQGTTEWRKYSIKIAISHSSDSIYLSATLSGTGKVWFDNFNVNIDYAPIENVKPIESRIYKASLDKEFDSGSKFNISQLSPKQSENLYKLGKIWGFIKYHHPEVAKGNINWDYELFRVLPFTTAVDFDAKMATWIKSIGALNPEKMPEKETGRVKIRLNKAWLSDDKLLSKSVSQQLLTIDKAIKETQHYYIGFAPQGNPLFLHEKVYLNMDAKDLGFRLLTLFRYWNMIEYFFPYKHLIDDNWDTVLQEFIPKFIDAKDDLSYRLAVWELICKIQDTHATVEDPVLFRFNGIYNLPFDIKFIDDKAVVVKVFTKENSLKLKVGDIITAINGIKITELMNQKIKYCSGSNRPTQLRVLAKLLMRTNEKTLKLSLETVGNAYEETINSITFSEYNKRKFPEGKKTEPCIEIGDSIAHILPNLLKSDEIAKIMSKCMGKKSIIFDMRNLPAVEYSSFCKYLMPKSTEFVKWTTGSLETPGQFSFKTNKPPIVGYNRNDYFKGKVIIIVNETTQSSSEYASMALRVAPKAIVVGSTTAAADGDFSFIFLPRNISTGITGNGCYYSDGTETQRVGIVPDVFVTPTIEGIRQGKDDVLEKAIEIANN